MTNEIPLREQTLDEYVKMLPVGHGAYREYVNLRRQFVRLGKRVDDLEKENSALSAQMLKVTQGD